MRTRRQRPAPPPFLPFGFHCADWLRRAVPLRRHAAPLCPAPLTPVHAPPQCKAPPPPAPPLRRFAPTSRDPSFRPTDCAAPWSRGPGIAGPPSGQGLRGARSLRPAQSLCGFTWVQRARVRAQGLLCFTAQGPSSARRRVIHGSKRRQKNAFFQSWSQATWGASTSSLRPF